MKRLVLSASLLILATTAAADPGGVRRRDQDAAFDAVRSGRSKPLPILERRVLPHVHGDYIGRPEYDAERNLYRMKFMRGRSVIWVDVDGRTGAIVGRSGE